jgi:hypothetical protein
MLPGSMASSSVRMSSMMRRLFAILGMLLVVAIVLTLVWRVYLHHRAADSDEDATHAVIARLRN